MGPKGRNPVRQNHHTRVDNHDLDEAGRAEIDLVPLYSYSAPPEVVANEGAEQAAVGPAQYCRAPTSLVLGLKHRPVKGLAYKL